MYWKYQSRECNLLVVVWCGYVCIHFLLLLTFINGRFNRLRCKTAAGHAALQRKAVGHAASILLPHEE